MKHVFPVKLAYEAWNEFLSQEFLIPAFPGFVHPCLQEDNRTKVNVWTETGDQ